MLRASIKLAWPENYTQILYISLENKTLKYSLEKTFF